MIRSWPLAWSPTRTPAFDDLYRELLAGRPEGAKPEAAQASWTPSVDVKETPEAYLIRVELPGLDPKDVEITLQERTLTLSGEKTSEATTDTDRLHVVERTYGSFKRSFTFPELVDAESVSAKTLNGLLTVEVKKVPEVKPKKITIKSE